MESELKRTFEQRNELHRLIFRRKYNADTTSKKHLRYIQQLCQANSASLKFITNDHGNINTLWQYAKCEDHRYTLRKEQALTILLEIAQRSQCAPFEVEFTFSADLVTYLTQLVSHSSNIQHTKLSISLLTIWINTKSKTESLQMDVLDQIISICNPHTDFEILSNISMFLHQIIYSHRIPNKRYMQKISKTLNFLLIYSQCEILWLVLSAYIRYMKYTEITAMNILDDSTERDAIRMQIDHKLTADDLLISGVIQEIQKEVTNIVPNGVKQLILNYMNPFALLQKVPKIHKNPLSKMVQLLQHDDFLVHSKALQALHSSVVLIQNDAIQVSKLFNYGLITNVKHLLFNRKQISDCFVFLLNMIYLADKYGHYSQIRQIGIESFMYGLTETIAQKQHSVCVEFEHYVLEIMEILMRFYRDQKENEIVLRMKRELWKLNMMNKKSYFIAKLISVLID